MSEAIWEWLRENYDPTVLAASVATILLGFVAVSIAERVYPAEKGQKPLRAGYNVVIMLAYHLIKPLAAFAGGSIAAFIIEHAGASIPLNLQGWLDGVPEGLRLIALVPLVAIPVALFDFCYYWMHVAQHRWAWFWQFHKLHHTDQALNVTTAFREHWMEEFFGGILTVVPVALLFDITPAEAGFLGVIIDKWVLFTHANMRISLGRLGYMVTGPQYHRIHHSIVPEHWNRNFAAYFPIWDILFGTAHMPQRDEWPATGVAGETSTPTLREALFGPFIANGAAIWRRVTARPADPVG